MPRAVRTACIRTLVKAAVGRLEERSPDVLAACPRDDRVAVRAGAPDRRLRCGNLGACRTRHHERACAQQDHTELPQVRTSFAIAAERTILIDSERECNGGHKTARAEEPSDDPGAPFFQGALLTPRTVRKSLPAGKTS